MILLAYISQGLKSLLSMTPILLRFSLLTGLFIFLLIPVKLTGQKKCDCPEFASIKKDGKDLKETDIEFVKRSITNGWRKGFQPRKNLTLLS